MGEGNDRVREEERENSEDEREEEEQATILYDVVSYREWEQEPEVVKKNDVLQGKSRGGWLQLTPPPSILPPRVEAIQVSRPPLF